MSKSNQVLSLLFTSILSPKARSRVERIILNVALVSFLLHLLLIYLKKFNLFLSDLDSELLDNPISAIYTPFSFILIYEVYLLIYYLPKSFTTYITKQYEIITLIIIRKLFKDLAALELTSDWFEIKGDLQFTYDLLASLVLFILIYFFQNQGRKKSIYGAEMQKYITNFIRQKQFLALLLIPLFFSMALYTLINWVAGISLVDHTIPSFDSINNLFFDQFFTVLILVDVIVLLISFFYVNQFHKIIRNSGFVISTILIRISFGVSGLISTILIVVAVIFGLAILSIHNKYEKSLEVG